MPKARKQVGVRVADELIEDVWAVYDGNGEEDGLFGCKANAMVRARGIIAVGSCATVLHWVCKAGVRVSMVQAESPVILTKAKKSAKRSKKR